MNWCITAVPNGRAISKHDRDSAKRTRMPFEPDETYQILVVPADRKEALLVGSELIPILVLEIDLAVLGVPNLLGVAELLGGGQNVGKELVPVDVLVPGLLVGVVALVPVGENGW